MISERKQGNSEVTHIEFDVGLFLVESCQKDQAKKVLEEAAEVYGAWEQYSIFPPDSSSATYIRSEVLEECADVAQAAFNMAYSLGYNHNDIARAMEECLIRNKERGRC